MEEMSHLKENAENDSKVTSINSMISKKSMSISRATWPQVLVTLAYFFVAFSTSMSASHSAILLPQLKSDNITDDYTAAWITSSYTIATPVGCFIGGISADIFGRKKMNILGSLGMVTGWILCLVVQDSMIFIVARIIEGTCKGLLNTVLTVTVDECADPRYRGMIICSTYIGLGVGFLITAILGATADWWTTALVATFLPIILLITCMLLPETATWLVRKQHVQEAHNVLRWFWGDHDVQAEEELQSLINRFHPHGLIRRTDRLDLISKIRHFTLEIWRTLRSPYTLKPFIIMHIFNILQVTTGYSHFVFYSVEILSEVTKNSTQEFLDAYISNVILCAVRLIFVLCATIVIYRLGRRSVALVSGVGCSVSALIVTILLYNKDNLTTSSVENWIIFIMIVLFCGFYSFGFFFLPTLMIGETQPGEIRSLVNGYLYTTNDLILGVVIQNYYSMITSIGIEGLFLMFVLSCLACTVFVYFFLPETHGKSLLEIEAYFHQENILWITRRKHTNNTQSKNEIC